MRVPEYEETYKEIIGPYFGSSASLQFSADTGYYLKVEEDIPFSAVIYNHTFRPICVICNFCM